MAQERLGPTVWATIEKGAQQALWLLLFIVMAPILGPRAYGLFALVMVLIGFCEFVIVDATSEAVMSIENLTPEHLAAANLGGSITAIAAGLVTALSAGWLADIFAEPDLVPLFRTLSILPLISALNAVPTAVLARDMRFRTLALRSMIGISAGGAAGLAIALHGGGAWALVIQALLQRTVSMIVLWRSAQIPFGLSWSTKHFRELMGYARNIFLSRSMNWIGGQLPRVMIGRFLGAADLGLLTIGTRLLDMLIQLTIAPRVRVARLELTQYRQNQAGLEDAFLSLVRKIEFFVLPLCCGGAAILPALFAAWLDARWQPGIHSAQILLLSGVPLAFLYCTSSLFLALGRPDQEAILATLQTAASVILSLLAVPFGLTWVSAAMAGVWLPLLPIPLTMIKRLAGISPLRLFRAIVPLLASATIMGLLTAYAGEQLIPMIGALRALLIQLPLGVLIYGGLIMAMAPDLARSALNQTLGLAMFSRLRPRV